MTTSKADPLTEAEIEEFRQRAENPNPLPDHIPTSLREGKARVDLFNRRLLATIDDLRAKIAKLETQRRVEYEMLVAEITAGCELFPKDAAGRAYNQGRFAASELVERYRDGKGLAQLAEAVDAGTGVSTDSDR